MSTATAPADAAAVAPKKGKKKLIIIIAAVLLVVCAGGGAAVFMMKKKAQTEAEAAEADGDEGHAKPKAAAKHDPKAVPTFVPLDPFTVNLADREAERYAQVGITLEIDDAKLGDQIKNFMPAIRNNILLAIADRSAAELLGREGKAALAERIRRETSRALGVEVDEPGVDEHADADEEKPKKKGKKKKKPPEVVLPIKAVHFSNFIVQ